MKILKKETKLWEWGEVVCLEFYLFSMKIVKIEDHSAMSFSWRNALLKLSVNIFA